MSWLEDKRERTEYFHKFVYGWTLQKCVACNGSGYYDHNESPKCTSCEGTGKVRQRGPKAQKK